MGYVVSYEQSRHEEVVYHVNNIAVDLRDGTILCRLVEILSDDWDQTLCSELRLPAVSLLQKVSAACKKAARARVCIWRCEKGSLGQYWNSRVGCCVPFHLSLLFSFVCDAGPQRGTGD